MPRRSTPTPSPVRRTLLLVGQHISHWRWLNWLTIDQVADRAGVSAATVQRIEKGNDANFENVLRVGRALGLLDRIIEAFDPQQTDVGRLRALEVLPKRVRPKREFP